MIDLLWPVRGSGLLGGVGVLVFLALILGTLPAGWALLRRRVGRGAAGPLWLLLTFGGLARRGGGLVDEQAAVAAVTTKEGGAFRQSTDEIFHSMLATDTEHWLPFAKPLRQFDVIPGPSEMSHPPAYYALASLVTRPVASAPLLGRLAAVRALGVVLAGWTVWVCGAVGRLIWRPTARRAEVPMALAVAVP